MKKGFKKFFRLHVIIITMLTFSLAFVACGGGSSGSSSGGGGGDIEIPSLHVSTVVELLDAISDGETRITVDSDITINEDVTIPSGTTIVIPDGVTVTIGSGKEITFTDGQILLEDTGDLKGTINFTLGTETIDGVVYYSIYTKFGLKEFADMVNGGSSSINGKLMANVALDKNNLYTKTHARFGTAGYAIVTDYYYTVDSMATLWTPIGTGTATVVSSAPVITVAYSFGGIFDGNGHTVSGLYTDVTKTVQGLFGCVVGGTIKNLTVSGCVAANFSAGGIAAYLESGTVENCINKANIFTNGGTTPNGNIENGVGRAGYVGGIVGLVAGTDNSIDLCTNNAEAIVCANSNMGGRTGGIIGLVNATTVTGSITRCLNTAFIDSYQYSGGIVGANFANGFLIDQCVNAGDVRGHSSGSTYVGGIISQVAGPITNCYNKGEVRINIDGSGGNKAAHFGGIASDLNAGATVANCYNIGIIAWGSNATVAPSSVGVIFGGGSSTVVTNCYAIASSVSTVGATVLSDANLKAAVSQLGTFFKADTGNINGGFPILTWQ